MDKPAILKSILVASLGGVVGVVAVTLLPQASVARVSKTDTAEIDVSRLERDIESRLMRRLDHLSAPRPANTEPSDVVPTAEPETVATPEMEQSRNELEQEFAKDIDQHQSDARDPSWAPSAEQGVESTIKKVEGSHKFVNVDCKTSSCLADVEWPSFDEAAKEYPKLLHASYQPNCAVKILFDEVEDKSAPITETLIFDCANARAND